MHWLDSVLVDMVHRMHDHGERCIGDYGSEVSWINVDTGIRRGHFEFLPRNWSHRSSLKGLCTVTAFQPYEPSVLGMVEFGLELNLTLFGDRPIPPDLLPEPQTLGGFRHEVGFSTISEQERLTRVICVKATWSTPAVDHDDCEGLFTHWLVHADQLVSIMSFLAWKIEQG